MKEIAASFFGLAKRANTMFYFAVTVISVIAVICAVLSAYMGVKLSTSTEYIYDTQYHIESSAWKLRVVLSEMDAHASQIVWNNGGQNTELIIETLAQLDKEAEEAVSGIIKYYDGPISYIDKLSSEIKLLAKLQSEYLATVLAEISETDKNEAEDFYNDKLSAQYTAADNAVEKIREYIEATLLRVMAEDKYSSTFTVVLSLSLGILMVSAAIFFSKFISKRNRDMYFHDTLFNLMSNNIDDVFFLFDLEKKELEYISSNIKRMFSVTADEFKKMLRTSLSNIEGNVKEEFIKIFNGHVIHDVMEREYRYKNSETGFDKTFLTRIHPIYKDGEVTRYIIVTYDKTDERQARDVIRDALISAQNANSAKRDFLSRMSHEIRTPMNAIIGMSAIATASIGNVDKVLDCLNKISYSSKHLLVLINDILDMSKIESGKMNLVQEPFSLPELLTSITSIIYPSATAKNISFDMMVYDITCETLVGDQLRLNQILLNLLSNAVKFTRNDGTVKLEVKQIKKYYMQDRIRIKFTISDTGIGMSEAFLKKQFTPFEQADSTISQKFGGTGLGMSITKNLVNLMNGVLDVKSELGKGSVFTVEIDFDIGETVEYKKDELGRTFEGLDVLVVDDDKGTCEHAELLLNKMGINAEWVTSGFEAEERVGTRYNEGNCYDICFIDWKMPEISGIETARRIRSIVGEDMLVIIISAYDWSSIERDAKAAGVNAFIPKPMFASSLYNTLITNVKSHKINNPNAETESNDDDSGYNFDGKKVLVAEDNEINMIIATELLEMAGLDVESAENGAEALELFEKSPSGYYSAILMDVQMPIMDGYQATKAIRQSQHTDALIIPILAMTANAFSDDITAAINAGMNEHIAKPINVDTLYSTIGKYVK